MRWATAGIVIAGTGLGHVNKPLYPAIKRAIEKGVTVVMTVQTLWGFAQMYVYDTGRDLLDLGIIPMDNMLPETAYMKLAWVLGQTDDPARNPRDDDHAGQSRDHVPRAAQRLSYSPRRAAGGGRVRGAALEVGGRIRHTACAGHVLLVSDRLEELVAEHSVDLCGSVEIADSLVEGLRFDQSGVDGGLANALGHGGERFLGETLDQLRLARIDVDHVAERRERS